MKKMGWIIFFGASVAGTAGIHAVESVLSAKQEAAYQSALQQWTHGAAVNAEIGAPPFGPKPERTDFLNWTEPVATSRQIQADALAKQARQAELQPLVREVVDPSKAVRTDARYQKAMNRKQRLLNLAETR